MNTNDFLEFVEARPVARTHSETRCSCTQRLSRSSAVLRPCQHVGVLRLLRDLSRKDRRCSAPEADVEHSPQPPPLTWRQHLPQLRARLSTTSPGRLGRGSHTNFQIDLKAHKAISIAGLPRRPGTIIGPGRQPIRQVWSVGSETTVATRGGAEVNACAACGMPLSAQQVDIAVCVSLKTGLTRPTRVDHHPQTTGP